MSGSVSTNTLNFGQLKEYSFNTLLSSNQTYPSYTSNPTWNIQEPVRNIDAFQISSFVGVNTVYIIDQRNNHLYFNENPLGTAGSTLTATVPIGNYTIFTLPAALALAMTSTPGATGTYTVAPLPAPNDNIIKITSTVNFIVDYGESNSMYYELGFTYPSTVYSLTQTGNAPYDLSGLKTINIVSGSLGSSHTYTVGSNYSIICNIPVSSGYGSVITFLGDPDFTSSPVGNLTNFNCILLDERMRPLNFQNDWCLTLIFKFL